MNKKTIIKWVFSIILLIVLSLIYYLNQKVYSPKALYIPKGSINKIVTYLEKRKFRVTKLDSFLLRFIGQPQSGWIAIAETNLSRGDFLYKLTTAKAPMQNITLVPGETTTIFLNELASKYSLNRKLLQKYYIKYTPILEGAIVPNTYSLPIGITEKQAVRILLSQSLRKMKKWSQKIFGTFNIDKWFQFVTIASVIQKEAASNEEMALVSSVIYNRIKKGMKLQMDGTLNYGKYSHQKVTPYRIRNDKSKYNTYKYKGVPHLPVCNVSLEAIKAAIFPATTNYLYFMKSKNGTHDFTRYYSTHLRNIKNATK
ncbi:MAG: endolytic transglycosylase MltG [Helicobacteraceae bacterium]|nr:endolytic transglycosylase MltG [Helicobacteraceae bacterium]